MSLKNIAPTVTHGRMKKDLEKLLEKYSGKASAQELLAISAKITGMLIALQDQRTMTADQATQIVAINIELGNRDVINRLTQSQGSA